MFQIFDHARHGAGLRGLVREGARAGRGETRRARVWWLSSWHRAQWQQWQRSAFARVRARSPTEEEIPANADVSEGARPGANGRQHLPCRRSWVRVPSSASQSPANSQFCRLGSKRPREAWQRSVARGRRGAAAETGAACEVGSRGDRYRDAHRAAHELTRGDAPTAVAGNCQAR
jgi:hypothetical protein